MKIVIICIVLLSISLLLITILQAFFVSKTKPSPFTNPSPDPQSFGNDAKSLTYVIIGDSTSAGQGGDYDKGIAVSTAKHLSQNYKITMTNLSKSGATLEDILNKQVAQAIALQPDLILISAGANDVTHLTSIPSVENNTSQIVDQLISANCNIKIVLTTSPEVGSVRLFPQPLRFVAGIQTNRVNATMNKVILKKNLTLAPIAEKTGPLFKKDPTLFAADKFHPNNKGYATWIPILNQALSDAINNQPSHCK